MSKKAVTEEKKMKKTEAFRLVIGEFGIEADVDLIVSTMKDRYDMVMDKNMASTYRSNERKRLADLEGGGNKPTRKAGRPAKQHPVEGGTDGGGTTGGNGSGGHGSGGNGSGGGSADAVEFMTEIREWENKLSRETIQKIVKVMYQS